MVPEPERLYVALQSDIKEVVRAIRKKSEVRDALRNLLEKPMGEELHLRSGLNGELDAAELEELQVGFLEFWETCSKVQLAPSIFDRLCDQRATFRHMLIAFQRAVSEAI